MEKVIIYRRVSTEGQEEKFGLESQLKDIKKYCDEHDYEIAGDYVDVISGAKAQRVGLNQILLDDNVRNTKLIIAKNDRLSREVMNYYSFKSALLKKNVELISIKEDFGELGAMAKILEAFTVAMADMERDLITQRTTGGRNVKASKGGYSGGQAPFGYDVVQGNLIVNEEKSKVVKYIFRLRKNGESLNAIANKLNEKGYKTARGGTKWYASAIQSVLRNEDTYLGYYQYGSNDKVVGKHEPILTFRISREGK